MRAKPKNAASRMADATHWFIATLSLLSIVELAWAFLLAGSEGLTSQQTTITNYFFAILSGGVGFYLGGVVVTVSGCLSPRIKLSIKAIGGSALFLIALYHPQFARVDVAQTASPMTTPVTGSVKITSPSPYAVVGRRVEVRGTTSIPGWRYFVVVSGPSAGSDVLQDGELEVSSSGEILGRATLGSVGVGAGQPYTIRVVASEKALPPGPFVQRKGLLFSNAISVIRSTQAEGS